MENVILASGCVWCSCVWVLIGLPQAAAKKKRERRKGKGKRKVAVSKDFHSQRLLIIKKGA